MKRIIPYAHELLQEIVQDGDITIDATCGNGNDTLLLSQLVGNNGTVHSFDIQEQAINNTSLLLKENHVTNVKLHLDGHENVDQYVGDAIIKGAIFNLGYLPGEDHSIITKPETTIEAIRKIQSRLAIGGRIVLVIYHGHEGGREEKESVLSYCEQLDQKHFEVTRYEFINQINRPPFVVAIEKRK